MPSATQRLAAVTVLRETRKARYPRFSGSRWSTRPPGGWARDAGEELARALLEAVCSRRMSANFVYLALIEPPGILA